MKRVPSAAELLMPKHLDELGVRWESEYQFARSQGRRWRADYAIPDKRIIVEVDGGLWLPGGGRHNRASGMLKDMEKLNNATLLGWKCYRFSPQQVESGYAKQFLAKALTNGHLY